MTPHLARRGRLLVVVAALFVSVGAIRPAWPLVALGTVILSSICTAYLFFFPVAVLLRRRKVEMAWWVPPGDQPGGAVTVDHPFSLHIALRNYGLRKLRVLDVKLFASSALDLPEGPIPADVPRGFEVELRLPLRARAAGYWALHGAVVGLGDLLGLFELRAYFPNPIGVKVFPRLSSPRSGRLEARPTAGALHERVGVHPIRRRGMAGELREIREHAHGDPFKFIAWKATARKRQLMVRELENEIVVTYQLLVDISGSMRGGSHGRTKLDYAVETASAIARASLEGGDRVGLITFDTRIYGQLKPDEGRPHHLKVIDRLLETRNVVDEDLTDITDGELVAAVARYLAHQEAIDVRLKNTPPIGDPAWSRIGTGPRGELYDMAALGRVVATLLKSDSAAAEARRAKAPAWWWQRVHIGEGADPEMARLRLFCRLRGIELPYRQADGQGQRAAGLAAALSHAAAGGDRAQVLLIISDLGGIADDPPTALRAVGLVRRRHHSVIAVAPFGPAFAPRPSSDPAQRVADILSLDERRRLEGARRDLVRTGVPVVIAGPEDSVAMIARRVQKTRSRLRGHG
jgi:uncharacterized protein (DUF58 family)